MKRKIIASIFAGSLTLAFACGCVGNNSIILPDRENASSTLRTVSFFGHRTDSSSLNVIESALQNFMSDNSDLNVSYESATETSYFSALDKRFKTDNLDDVFMTDRDRLITFMQSNSLADVSASVNMNVFNDFALSQAAYSGDALLAVPTSISTYGLYVNYDLLQKHGISVPKNYADFVSACSYFVENGVTPVILNNYSSVRTLITAVGLAGVYLSGDTSTELEKFNADPTSLCSELDGGVDFIYTMIENGWIDTAEAKNCSHLAGDIQLFAKGERPFMITAGYAAADLRKLLKENNSSLNFGIYPYPVLDSGSVLVAQADAMLCVRNGDDAEAGKKLVGALTSYPVLMEMTEGQSCFTALRGQTQIHSDAALIPSASYLTSGRFVIGSDINLKIPLDTYLNELSDMIFAGHNADAVKSHLYALLDGGKAGER